MRLLELINTTEENLHAAKHQSVTRSLRSPDWFAPCDDSRFSQVVLINSRNLTHNLFFQEFFVKISNKASQKRNVVIHQRSQLPLGPLSQSVDIDPVAKPTDRQK